MYTDGTVFGEADLLAGHLGDFIDLCVDMHGDNDAFTCVLPTGHHATLTHRQLGKYSDAVAAYLRDGLGLNQGDVVAIQAPNVLGYPVLAFGIMKAGLTVTNVNPLYTVEEAQHQLKDSHAKVLFVIDLFGDRVKGSIDGTEVRHVYKLSLLDFFPQPTRAILGFALKHIKKLVPPFSVKSEGTLMDVVKEGRRLLDAGAEPKFYREGRGLNDIAFYQYTGGTTGRSKGAALTHRNVIANMSQSSKRSAGLIAENDSMLLVLPLYHVYALAVGAMASMHNGVHVVLVPVPRPIVNLKHAFEKFDITVMPGVNTLFLGLMQEGWFRENPPKTLRMCFAGAAPLQPATAQAWTDLTGAPIYEGYGLTEGTCIVTSTPFTEQPRPGSCGKPMPGTVLRIVGEDGRDLPPGEPGELWIKGPQVMLGYLNAPEATAAILADGWLRTGDIAKVDDEGYLYIVDRLKDMVIVSGFNVFPTDIESVLTRHSRINDAAVVGVPDHETGERVVAYVVPGDNELTPEEVRDYCREHLTGYKVPKSVVLIDELPKSPVGKVLRRELRDRARIDFASVA
ncbi:AMP-binding protein [Gimibacter soli]|uniref:3-methylmercaptopropionyl-CoA ligase n=1 Tax=Gimibacter soli TaxID=3024400 RepID=A0AAE9XKL4_9PROT|nr:AMP-binding protein [Gimibacter soli]WCL52662.1 AMP-binding protein [Gimibacter soli]